MGALSARWPPQPGPGSGRQPLGLDGINYRQTINDNMLVVIMIETPTGVANAFDIASVPGVDVVIIGNNDLSSFSGFAQTRRALPSARPESSRRHPAGRKDFRPGQRLVRDRSL